MLPDEKNSKKPEISIILPCLNEEKAINFCLKEIKETIKKHSLDAEVIVVDNASTDHSAKIVTEQMTIFPELVLVKEPRRGYGSTYLKGLEVAKGEYIFMADCDGSYDLKDIPRFLEKMKTGADLVVGNRFNKNMHKKSMPWHHKHIGNPFLSRLSRILFKTNISDMPCGIRSIKKSALSVIELQTAGMEFSAEMVIKSAKKGLEIKEIPINYRERYGESKLRSFADGWRYLRFILIYSPFALFLIPGSLLFISGTLLFLFMYFFNLELLGIQFVFHPLFLFSGMIIIGYQLVIFAGFAKTYAITHLGESDLFVEKLLSTVTIEKACVLGIITGLLGASIFTSIFIQWIDSGMGSLDQIKNSILGLTLLIVGTQTIFSSFMISILGIKEK